MKKKIFFILIVIFAIILSLTLYRNHQQQNQKDEYFIITKSGYKNKVMEIIRENGLETKIEKQTEYKDGHHEFYLKISESEMKRIITTNGITQYLFYWGNTKTVSNMKIGPMQAM